MARKLLWASLALAPITFVVDFAFHPGDVALFVLAAATLIPLAWLIGESTEQASEHTGPGIGGFLNASFGNAPELIIATFAVADSLPNVVRGSLAGSVVSNLLLVLGVAMAVGETGKPINRNSLLLQLGFVGTAVVLFLVPSVAGWHGDPERHSLAVLSAPIAVVLLLLYVVVQTMAAPGLPAEHAASGYEERADAWPLRRALVALALATAATARDKRNPRPFARRLREGGRALAVLHLVRCRRGRRQRGRARRRDRDRPTREDAAGDRDRRLVERPGSAVRDARDRACSPGSVRRALPLAFRWEEIGAMALATVVVAAVVFDGTLEALGGLGPGRRLLGARRRLRPSRATATVPGRPSGCDRPDPEESRSRRTPASHSCALAR